MDTSENLSGAAILIFRRYLKVAVCRCSAKQVFLKLCEILRKAHMPESIFNTVADLEPEILSN